MRTITAALLSLCLLLLAAASEARGQTSGSSRLGEALSVQSTSGATQSLEDVGTLQGSERYLRKNRRPTDFVGPDGRESRRYVGALQARARGTVPLTTQGLTRRVDRSESMNQPLRPTRRGTVYQPRLEISFEAPALTAEDLPARRALDTLARSPQLSGPSRIVVSMAGRTAILQGEVPSARDREIAEILLSFEPGISAIQNELQLNPDLREAEDSLSALRRQQTPQEAWTTLNPVTSSPARALTSATERSF
jgi:hypothetical protein